MIGRIAVDALCEEARTAPKPGLVDPWHRGAHGDMDYPLFIRSARSLHSYFESCGEEGRRAGEEPGDLFPRLRALGLEAERTMFAATEGINTHKGSVFTLGLLCAAAGMLSATADTRVMTGQAAADSICLLAGRVCAGVSRRDFSALEDRIAGSATPAGTTASGGETPQEGIAGSVRAGTRSPHACAPGSTLTAGERLHLRYGFTGIRGEAEAGFPVLRTAVMPRLLAGPVGASVSGNPTTEAHRQAAGGNLVIDDPARSGVTRTAKIDALLASMAVLEDSCVLSRGGLDGLAALRDRAAAILAAGGSATPAGGRLLSGLDAFCCSRNLSPGGSADMLAAGLFLFRTVRVLRG